MVFTKKKDFTGLSREEILKSASERIYRSVSVAEQSSLKLKSKLSSVGYPEDVIEDAIQNAVSIGAVDDRRYSECLMRTTIMQGRGIALISKEIEKLGIDVETLETYAEYMNRGTEEHISDAIDYLSRHIPKAKDKRSACYRKLISKGYSSDIASSASRIFCEQLKDNLQD